MKKRKTIGYISLAFLVITLAGCGYTKEEKADMKRYEAQGLENAERLYQRKVWSGCENQGSDLREI